MSCSCQFKIETLENRRLFTVDPLLSVDLPQEPVIEQRFVGDLNSDGNVDLQDFEVLDSHFGQADATAEQGDLNSDGTVGFTDFLRFANQYQQPQSELIVEGTDADEQIIVEQVADQIRVRVDDVERYFAAEEIDSIRIDAGAGNDTVVQHTDIPATIHGGESNDGLYSRSVSELFGDEGSDRFLMAHTNEGSFGTPADQTPDEVRIHLHDGEELSVDFGQFNSTARYAAGSFGADEVALLDEVFAQLQDRTGNQRILQTGRGSETHFHRQGEQLDGDDAPGAWNEAGHSHLTDEAFAYPQAIKQTILHEIAHNWDHLEEHPLVEKFREASGWQQVSEVSEAELASGELMLSEDGQWVYDADASFWLDYQRTDPYEDFAVTFVGYFISDADSEFTDPKLAALDELVSELTDSGTVVPEESDSVYAEDTEAHALGSCNCDWIWWGTRLRCTWSWGFCDYYMGSMSYVGNHCYSASR